MTHRQPPLFDLIWTAVATVLGLVMGIVACAIVEACR